MTSIMVGSSPACCTAPLCAGLLEVAQHHLHHRFSVQWSWSCQWWAAAEHIQHVKYESHFSGTLLVKHYISQISFWKQFEIYQEGKKKRWTFHQLSAHPHKTSYEKCRQAFLGCTFRILFNQWGNIFCLRERWGWQIPLHHYRENTTCEKLKDSDSAWRNK